MAGLWLLQSGSNSQQWQDWHDWTNQPWKSNAESQQWQDWHNNDWWPVDSYKDKDTWSSQQWYTWEDWDDSQQWQDWSGTKDWKSGVTVPPTPWAPDASELDTPKLRLRRRCSSMSYAAFPIKCWQASMSRIAWPGSKVNRTAAIIVDCPEVVAAKTRMPWSLVRW